jgi:hypothetical protein
MLIFGIISIGFGVYLIIGGITEDKKIKDPNEMNSALHIPKGNKAASPLFVLFFGVLSIALGILQLFGVVNLARGG